VTSFLRVFRMSRWHGLCRSSWEADFPAVGDSNAEDPQLWQWRPGEWRPGECYLRQSHLSHDLLARTPFSSLRHRLAPHPLRAAGTQITPNTIHGGQAFAGHCWRRGGKSSVSASVSGSKPATFGPLCKLRSIQLVAPVANLGRARQNTLIRGPQIAVGVVSPQGECHLSRRRSPGDEVGKGQDRQFQWGF